jgi:hypothetical protein
MLGAVSVCVYLNGAWAKEDYGRGVSGCRSSAGRGGRENPWADLDSVSGGAKGISAAGFIGGEAMMWALSNVVDLGVNPLSALLKSCLSTRGLCDGSSHEKMRR